MTDLVIKFELKNKDIKNEYPILISIWSCICLPVYLFTSASVCREWSDMCIFILMFVVRGKCVSIHVCVSLCFYMCHYICIVCRL